MTNQRNLHLILYLKTNFDVLLKIILNLQNLIINQEGAQPHPIILQLYHQNSSRINLFFYF